MPGYLDWLAFAKENLKAARAAHKYECFSSAAYGCQQSAEKAIKGYLLFKGKDIIKTHDLVDLLGMCKKFDITFEKLCEEEDGTIVYYPNMKKTKHECKNTRFNIPEYVSDKHVIAALQYTVERFSKIGETYGIGIIESFMDPNILPQDILELSDFLKKSKKLKSIELMEVVEAYKKARYASKHSS